MHWIPQGVGLWQGHCVSLRQVQYFVVSLLIPLDSFNYDGWGRLYPWDSLPINFLHSGQDCLPNTFSWGFLEIPALEWEHRTESENTTAWEKLESDTEDMELRSGLHGQLVGFKVSHFPSFSLQFSHLQKRGYNIHFQRCCKHLMKKYKSCKRDQNGRRFSTSVSWIRGMKCFSQVVFQRAVTLKVKVLVDQSCLTLWSPWTINHQTPLSMGFSSKKQVAIPSPGDLPDPGIKPGSPALRMDSLLSELPPKAQQQLYDPLTETMFKYQFK